MAERKMKAAWRGGVGRNGEGKGVLRWGNLESGTDQRAGAREETGRTRRGWYGGHEHMQRRWGVGKGGKMKEDGRCADDPGSFKHSHHSRCAVLSL